jgi:hypothetical protein
VNHLIGSILGTVNHSPFDSRPSAYASRYLFPEHKDMIRRLIGLEGKSLDVGGVGFRACVRHPDGHQDIGGTVLGVPTSVIQ